MNAAGAFIITTAERAKDMKQKPVYVLNHNQGRGGTARSSYMTLDEWMEGKYNVARMVYEGSGLRPEDVDIFNPYDRVLALYAPCPGGFPMARSKGRGRKGLC